MLKGSNCSRIKKKINIILAKQSYLNQSYQKPPKDLNKQTLTKATKVEQIIINEKTK